MRVRISTMTVNRKELNNWMSKKWKMKMLFLCLLPYLFPSSNSYSYTSQFHALIMKINSFFSFFCCLWSEKQVSKKCYKINFNELFKRIIKLENWCIWSFLLSMFCGFPSLAVSETHKFYLETFIRQHKTFELYC